MDNRIFWMNVLLAALVALNVWTQVWWAAAFCAMLPILNAIWQTRGR